MIFADFEIWALGPGIGPIHRPVITKSAILGITAAAAAAAHYFLDKLAPIVGER